jgi:hypothetical protein
VPLNGDFTKIEGTEYGPVDLLVGGTPCQSFSVAGLRGGLGDDRGNLALEYLRLADRARPRWVVWENVPGVLSSNGGRDFGAILGGMVELGYGSPTECLTLSSLEFPSAAVACSLSDILETGDVPQRYYLSATACRGILRRAEKRGKRCRPSLQGLEHAAPKTTKDGRTPDPVPGVAHCL